MKKPDHEVAERIIVEFQKHQIFQPEVIESLGSRLISGSLTQDDWTSLVETELLRQEAMKCEKE